MSSMECPEEATRDEWQVDLEREMRISSLAMRYRSGERSVLGELHAELEPFIRCSLRTHTARGASLPAGVDPEDLFQQAFVALAEAVLAWEPGRRANFVPYFLGSFPWRIDHYLRSQTPSRRTSRFHLFSTPHDLLMERVAGRPGSDGRDWDGALACGELLRALPEACRRVVRLHLFDGLPFAEVGRVMGISRSTAHETYGRAVVMMRTLLDGD